MQVLERQGINGWDQAPDLSPTAASCLRDSNDAGGLASSKCETSDAELSAIWSRLSRGTKCYTRHCCDLSCRTKLLLCHFFSSFPINPRLHTSLAWHAAHEFSTTNQPQRLNQKQSVVTPLRIPCTHGYVRPGLVWAQRAPNNSPLARRPHAPTDS